MAEHPNAERLRRGYEAFDRGDMDALRNEFLHPDLVFHVTGTGRLNGDYKGVDEVFGFFGKLMELTGGNLRNEVHEVLANDTHGVVLVDGGGTRDGKTLEMKEVHVHHLDRDGKTVEFWGLVEDSAKGDEFFA